VERSSSAVATLIGRGASLDQGRIDRGGISLSQRMSDTVDNDPDQHQEVEHRHR